MKTILLHTICIFVLSILSTYGQSAIETPIETENESCVYLENGDMRNLINENRDNIENGDNTLCIQLPHEVSGVFHVETKGISNEKKDEKCFMIISKTKQSSSAIQNSMMTMSNTAIGNGSDDMFCHNYCVKHSCHCMDPLDGNMNMYAKQALWHQFYVHLTCDMADIVSVSLLDAIPIKIGDKTSQMKIDGISDETQPLLLGAPQNTHRYFTIINDDIKSEMSSEKIGDDLTIIHVNVDLAQDQMVRLRLKSESSSYLKFVVTPIEYEAEKVLDRVKDLLTSFFHFIKGSNQRFCVIEQSDSCHVDLAAKYKKYRIEVENLGKEKEIISIESSLIAAPDALDVLHEFPHIPALPHLPSFGQFHLPSLFSSPWSTFRSMKDDHDNNENNMDFEDTDDEITDDEDTVENYAANVEYNDHSDTVDDELDENDDAGDDDVDGDTDNGEDDDDIEDPSVGEKDWIEDDLENFKREDAPKISHKILPHQMPHMHGKHIGPHKHGPHHIPHGISRGIPDFPMGDNPQQEPQPLPEPTEPKHQNANETKGRHHRGKFFRYLHVFILSFVVTGVCGAAVFGLFKCIKKKRAARRDANRTALLHNAVYNEDFYNNVERDSVVEDYDANNQLNGMSDFRVAV